MILRWIRHTLSGSWREKPDAQQAHQHLRQRSARALSLLRIIFVGVYFLAIWLGPTAIDRINDSGANLFMWPIRWFPLMGSQTAAHLVFYGLLATALLAACWPQRQLWRLMCWIFFFFFAAILSSFGGVTHLVQFWLWALFLIGFIPDFSLSTRSGRLQLLTGIQAAQAMVLLFYTLSGFWKLEGAVEQFLRGEATFFSGTGLASHVASEVIRAGASPPLGLWISSHPLPAVFLSCAVVYLQLFSFAAAFRPNLHRLWGLMILGFHLGTYLFLSITYPTNVLLIGLLLVCSPFADESEEPGQDLARALKSLPLVGRVKI